ncbi:DUF4436 domain-containing protein [Mycobacterium sp. 94-17]|uniref:DUF4436 domain-containing protein n=1 Tax=Mycobacterium sp. 94-17 TaxID=2986147 RepID=UPI002D1EB919|nr:DUF4436 domain-containing protein [Mycobacterium sp. 94-17]MEB4211231.1 DUF4436 domain-containing protein [Mycobacterium sp. 94-17]
MITSVVLYIDGVGPHRVSNNGPSATSGTIVTLNVENIQSDYGALLCDLAISPGPTLVDPATDGLKEDLTVEIASTAMPVKRTWSKGTLPGVFPVPLTLARDVERWPFDRYYTGPIRVELFDGAGHARERASVTIVDRLPGWKIQASEPIRAKGGPSGTYVVEMQRSPSTVVFAVVILCILVAIAGAAVFVAVQTLRDRRKFQSPMTAWYAAMLFAVVPLRNALPGSPAFGSWIDMTIVLWVLVALVVSMLLYIASWWRHLRPDSDDEAVAGQRPTELFSEPSG